jgi:hypothetical protein
VTAGIVWLLKVVARTTISAQKAIPTGLRD